MYKAFECDSHKSLLIAILNYFMVGGRHGTSADKDKNNDDDEDDNGDDK